MGLLEPVEIFATTKLQQSNFAQRSCPEGESQGWR